MNEINEINEINAINAINAINVFICINVSRSLYMCLYRSPRYLRGSSVALGLLSSSVAPHSAPWCGAPWWWDAWGRVRARRGETRRERESEGGCKHTNEEIMSTQKRERKC